MPFSSKLLFVLVLVLTSTQRTRAKLSDNEVSKRSSADPTTTNQSSSTKVTNATMTTSLITALSSPSPSASRRAHRKTTSPTVSEPSNSNLTVMTPYILASYLIDQFNHYREVDILSRIKHCDSSMKLNEMCETYSFDNHTYSLMRQSSVEFQSFQHVYDALVDRLVVQKLSQFCSPGHWCLANLTQDDIRFTVDVLRQRGRSFCSLERCHHRLAVHINSCPTILSRVNSQHHSTSISLWISLSRISAHQCWNSCQCSVRCITNNPIGTPKNVSITSSIFFISSLPFGHRSK